MPKIEPDETAISPVTLRKRRILFVDDMRTILLSLERLLRPHRHEWDMKFTRLRKRST